MRFGLDDKYFNELTAILRAIPEIEEAVIYGSRARGDYRNVSDIDLSLRGTRLENKHVVRLKSLLYESRIPYFFDIHIFHQLRNPQFIANVERDGIVCYRREA
ncbi:nucleotidyltransferase domain-containing protein [Prevotella sp. A2931]|uniref:Nucleotidyltransferase domain-containing protein n=1 Tax=Prevotella illustrans TaxID=2800387 RepID=A0ABS3M211_9BACT|nr:MULTISPECIES: nucleotidyltransferase domain-containing protein [Prevotella]MBO1362222.1 nucleotidyltransferase domain-containing protein [Prevotella illustrans]PTL26505.1 hypothetical protein C3V39_05260 [Prevotella sp. oral taxon 820]